jgi:hypothetical protein
MFANNVEVMEVPQKFSNVPSAVWLEIFDCRLISSGKPLYLFTSAAVCTVRIFWLSSTVFSRILEESHRPTIVFTISVVASSALRP